MGQFVYLEAVLRNLILGFIAHILAITVNSTGLIWLA